MINAFLSCKQRYPELGKAAAKRRQAAVAKVHSSLQHQVRPLQLWAQLCLWQLTWYVICYCFVSFVNMQAILVRVVSNNVTSRDLKHRLFPWVGALARY